MAPPAYVSLACVLSASLAGSAAAAAAVSAAALPQATSFAAVWSGVDMSQLGTEDSNGTDSPFRASASGPTVDALLLMKQSGVNVFRMRQWNEPCADGRCDPSAWDYAGQAGVLLMARRCQVAQLHFVLDLHYSDWWADPGKQYKPQAWLRLPYKQLLKAVYNFTKMTVKSLVDQGTPPYAVQIGKCVQDQCSPSYTPRLSSSFRLPSQIECMFRAMAAFHVAPIVLQ
jgi:arabinogalactan endo-1,4-beta-galactosidase